MSFLLARKCLLAICPSLARPKHEQSGNHQVHLGSFILRRGYSEGLLNDWRGEFTQDDYLDRISFMKAVGKRLDIQQEQWNTDDTSIVERRNHMVGPLVNGDSFLREEAGESDAAAAASPTCFTHISGARCEAYGKAFVDGVVSKFVGSYDNDYCRDTQSWRGWALFKLERLGVSVEDTCARTAQHTFLACQDKQGGAARPGEPRPSLRRVECSPASSCRGLR
eukprot:scaffold2321_cov245-Pinguiococcus_pyrenoidosus.AAC.8